MADEEQPPATEAPPPEAAPVEETPAEGAAPSESLASPAVVDEESPAPRSSRSIGVILDVKLAVSAELGRTRMPIADLLRLAQGSIIELDKVAGEPLDFFINDKRVAKGEAVILNEKFGVRILEIMSAADLVRQFAPKDS